MPHPLPFLFLFLFLGLLGGGSSTAEDELRILLELRSHLTTANDAAFQSWHAGNSPCSFSGVSCDPHGSVSEIDLADTGISGEIPFGSLCRLPSLSVLSLGSNFLAGGISPELRNCTGLRRLDLADNDFSGEVPDLTPLGLLQMLNLSDNALAGPFPWSSLENLTDLRALGLGSNHFDPDLFPEEVTALRKLNWLYLPGCSIGGAIPPSIGNLTELIVLELPDNFLTGGIPPEITRLSKLWMLELYNNSLAGRIPAGFSNLSRLAYFDASRNKLEGDLFELRGLRSLVSLQLFMNNLSGVLPLEFGEFQHLVNLSLYMNSLTGELPPKLGSFAEFDFIDVSTNFFTGRIPPDMCRRGTMKRLLVLENNFTGEIPASYGNCSSLLRFRVNKNLLTGEVPAGLWSLPNLNIIDLAGNQFEGLIGSGIGRAESLYQLFLSNNRFSGELPPEIGGAASIVNIDLSYNQISGQIPASIGDLKSLQSLNLQNNAFSGSIPDAIGSCASLSSIDLRANNLSGPIPASLGQLMSLSSLDLSDNQLSGEIPASLGTLKLSAFDLSNNHLAGAIPAVLAVAAYNVSFAGNPGLCLDGGGANSLRFLRRCTTTRRVSSEELRLTITTFLAGVSVILACIGICIVLRKRQANGCGRNLRIVKDPSWDLKSFRILAFDKEEIINCIKPENLIGRGGSGDVYRAELASGEVVAVKQIWNTPAAAGEEKERTTAAMLGPLGRRRRPAVKEFEAEVATLSAVRHVNVVKLYCSITSEESSLLVYEHLPNGSLWDWLHGPPAEIPGKAGGELGWEERYEIAVGAARGLEYLHHGWDRPILHGDVKSSNILLDEYLKPRIADFGLAKVLYSAAADSAGDASSTHVIAGTHGYIAPEYAYTWKVNEKSDVYSFGVVLMELVTRRLPVEAEYGENKDIVHWASRRLERSRESMVGLVDERIPEWAKGEAVRVLRVAMLCTTRLPPMRPSMRTVVHMLEEAGRFRASPAIGCRGKDERVETSGCAV